MKKKEVLDIIEGVTPESTTEEAQEAYKTLTETKGVNKVYVVNAAQKVFDLGTVSGMKVLSSFDRADLVRVTVAARHGVFDFGALVFPRKTPDGKEEGTYTYPKPEKIMAAIEAAYDEEYEKIDIDDLLPPANEVGGKVPKVSFKKVVPKGKAPRKSSSSKKEDKPKPAAAETPTPQEEPVADKPAPDKDTRPHPTAHVDLDLEGLSDDVATKVAHLLAPGIQRSFAVVGKGQHAAAHVFTSILQRQDALAETLEVLGCYLDPEFEGAEFPEAPVNALQSLIASARTLVGEENVVDAEVPDEKPVKAPPKEEVEEKPVKAPPKEEASTKEEAPEKKKAEPSGDLYSSADLEDIDAGDIDLRRVNFSEDMLRAEYGVPVLKKIIEAFGEVPGAPTRGLLVNRVLSLAKRDQLLD